MRITNEDARISVAIMQTLNETGKLGYAIARNLRKMKAEITEYVEFRNALVMKYGRSDKNGNYTLQKENLTQFAEELGDLPKEEIVVDVYTIPEDIFCSGSLNSQQMEVLMWMVE